MKEKGKTLKKIGKEITLGLISIVIGSIIGSVVFIIYLLMIEPILNLPLSYEHITFTYGSYLILFASTFIIHYILSRRILVAFIVGILTAIVSRIFLIAILFGLSGGGLQ